MGLLEILKYPDPILKTPAKPVVDLDENLDRFIEDMIQTMYHAPGIGLAAPQLGLSRRLIVLDPRSEQAPGGLIVLINPEIILREGTASIDEGCLSVPDYTAEVKRSARVQVIGMDRKGKPMDLVAEDLMAIILQHEIDHLDGILFIDRLSSLKRALYKQRLKKQMARTCEIL